MFLSHLIEADVIERMKKARLSILGERKDRDGSKPRFANGKWHGGTQYESSEHAKHIEKSERCHTLAQSVQVPRNLVGPTVGAKIPKSGATTHHDIRLEALQVCSFSLNDYTFLWPCRRSLLWL